MSENSMKMSQTHLGLPSELLAFRNAYLKSIAYCWNNPERTNEILSPTTSLVSGADLQFEIEFNNLLDKNKKFSSFLEYDLNWRVDAYVVNYTSFDKLEKVSSNDNFGNTKFSSKYYSPFDPNAINGWVGYTDVMVIKIPNKPKNTDDFTTPLSAYYDLFNTFFGNPNCENKPSGKHVTYRLNEIANYLGHIQKKITKQQIVEDVLLGNASSDLGDGTNSQFEDFGAIFLTIIAACWENPEYQDYILGKHLLPLGNEGSTLNDQYVQFTNTWNFTIFFRLADENYSVWDGDKWNNVENNVLLLNYPLPPVAANKSEDHVDPGLRALAFSKYNNTGPQYPLTCPC